MTIIAYVNPSVFIVYLKRHKQDVTVNHLMFGLCVYLIMTSKKYQVLYILSSG